MNLLRRLTPFLMLLVLVLVLSFGMMLLFYLILLSFVVSLVLYVVTFVRNRFFSPRPKTTKTKSKSGRVIDSDEWHHL